MLESILDAPGIFCTQRIKFLLVFRDQSHSVYCVRRSSGALAKAEATCISVDVGIAATSVEESLESESTVEKLLDGRYNFSLQEAMKELNVGNTSLPYLLVYFR